tara:strand:- start:844 stop:2661 length:1818 start_codon:yes stop_codon:yes gene_type:complete
MAKKTTTGRVVDIAALGRIGQSINKPKEENKGKGIDKFLQFAGQVAINLFSNAFKEKQVVNAQNRSITSKVKTDLSDASSLMTNLDPYLTSLGDKLNATTKEIIGPFSGVRDLVNPDRVDKGYDDRNKILSEYNSIKPTIQQWLQLGEQHNNVFTNKEISDTKGNTYKVRFDQSASSDVLNITQANAQGFLNKHVEFKEGKAYIKQGWLDLYEQGKKVDGGGPFGYEQADIDNFTEREKNNTLSSEEAELVELKDIEFANYDTSAMFNAVVDDIIGGVGEEAIDVPYNPIIHGVNMRRKASAGIEDLTPNQLKSYFFSGKGLSNYFAGPVSSAAKPIDTFIEDPRIGRDPARSPRFEIMLDIDLDGTKEKFTGTRDWLYKQVTDKNSGFGDIEGVYRIYPAEIQAIEEVRDRITYYEGSQDNSARYIFDMESIVSQFNAEQLKKYTEYKQGVIEQLKSELNFEDARMKNTIIDYAAIEGKIRHDLIWSQSPKNPNSPNYVKPQSESTFTPTFDERASTSNMNAILALSKKEKINFDDDIKFNFMPASDDLELRFDETTNEVILSQKKLYKDEVSVINLGKAKITDRNKLKGLLYEYTGTLTQDRR